MKGTLTTILICVGFVIVVFLVASLFYVPLSNAECYTYKQMNPDYSIKWNFFTGCVIQTPDGFWTPIANYRIIEQ